MGNRWKLSILGLVLAAVAGFIVADTVAEERPTKSDEPTPTVTAKATFAGGCFWCVEPPFDKLDGVISTTSGYTQGDKVDPTYEEVCTGTTGHTEAVQIIYDPAKVTYKQLLSTFWHNIDPTDARGQFCDKGNQYRSGIYYHDAEQMTLAEESKQEVAQELSELLAGKEIATEIKAATTFYPAEKYHQDYKSKNALRYEFYRLGCGRDARLEAIWGEKAGK